MMNVLHLWPTGDRKLRYIHEISDSDIPLEQLKTIVPSAEELELREWVKRAAVAGLDPVFVQLFQSVVTERQLSFPQLSRTG
jgi:hypothetical protein